MFARATRYSSSVMSVANFWRADLDGGTFAVLEEDGAPNSQGFVRFN